MNEHAKVVGRLEPAEIEALTKTSREEVLAAARSTRPPVAVVGAGKDVALSILDDAVEVQLALGGRMLELSPGDQDRRSIFDRLHRIQRAARGLLTAGQAPNSVPAREITEGYRGDISAHAAGLCELLGCVVDSDYLDGLRDDELRLLGLAAESLAGRITSYLSVKAAVS